jgi:TolA-binding protein
MKKVFFIIFLCTLPSLLMAQINEERTAMQFYQDGEFQKAALILKKIVEKTKDDSWFNFYFNALLKSKQYDEAEQVTKKLIRQNPASLQYEVLLGRIYKEKGQQENAAKAFNHVVNSIPKDEFIIRELANNLYQMAEYDLAIQVFIQGRKIMDNEQLFTFDLINLYRFKRDKSSLITEFLNALSGAPQMLQQAQTSFSSVFESNSDYLNLQNALYKKIQKDPQNESYVKLLIWQFIQQQEYDMALRQLIALDKRMKDDGFMLFEQTQIFVSNKAYKTAVDAYTYLLAKGKDNPYQLQARLGMLEARYQLLLLGKNGEKEVMLLADQYQSILDEYGKTPATLFALRKMATMQAYYLHRLDLAEATLETALEIQGISDGDKGELKLELADVYTLNNQPWEAILLYGQVAKEFDNQRTGNEANYRTARLSFYQGNFTYAKSQADVLKASTTQLIANDALNLSLLLSDHLETKTDTMALKMYAAAEFLQFKNQYAAALLKLDSIPKLYPQNSLADEILMSKSQLYIKTKEYSTAAMFLQDLIKSPQTNIWTDDALFILAGLYERELGKPAEAQLLYQKLITDFPGSMFTAEARKHFRKLRGDNIES